MAYNGGKTQLCLWFVGIDSGAYPFMNHALSGQGWNTNGGSYDQSKHDSNGYMHTKYGTSIYNRTWIPSQADRPGNYILLWDGGGNVGLGGSGDTSGRRVCTTPSSPCDITVNSVTSDGVDYPHNIRFVHEDDEAALALDPYAFNTHFLNILINNKYGVLRFLDWLNNNLSNLTRWADRCPVTYYCYGANNREIVPKTTGTMTNSGDAYTVAHTGWTLTDKRQITVQWNATSSGTAPTIDIEGTGAKAIREPSGDWQLSTLYAEHKPTSGVYSTLTYDSTLDCYLIFGWSNSYHGIKAMVPYEIMAKLCNEVGAHPWLPTPYLAVDPMSDLVTEVCTYFKNNCPGLIPRIEPPNELWNSLFYSTRYAWAMERAKGHGNFDTHYWYGRALAKVGAAVRAVYPTVADCQVMCGVQSNDLPANNDERLESTRYIAEGGIAAKTVATHISPAGYWGAPLIATAYLGAWLTATSYVRGNVVSDNGGYFRCLENHTSGSTTKPRTGASWATNWAFFESGEVTEETYITEYLAATSDAERARIAAEFLQNEGFPLYPEFFTETMDWFENFQLWGAARGVTGLSSYEGGFDATRAEDGGGTANQNTFRDAVYASDYHHALFHKHAAHYERIGGTFWSHLVFSGKNRWALYYPDEYATPSPQIDGMRTWSQGRRRFTLTASATAPFALADVFTGGYTGALYEFDDTTKCFSDAGTTPISNGVQLYQVNDKSGNGNHLIKGAASTGLVWNSDGYVTFNGTDDYLHMLSSLDSYNKAACAVFALVKARPGLDRRLVSEAGSSDSDVPLYCLMQSQSNTLASSQSAYIRNDAGSLLFSNGNHLKAGAFNNTKKFIGVVDNGTNLDSIRPYWHGHGLTPVSITRSGTLTTSRFSVGAILRATPGYFFEMDLYKLLIVHKVPSATEIAGIKRIFSEY